MVVMVMMLVIAMVIVIVEGDCGNGRECVVEEGCGDLGDHFMILKYTFDI